MNLVYDSLIILDAVNHVERDQFTQQLFRTLNLNLNDAPLIVTPSLVHLTAVVGDDE